MSVSPVGIAQNTTLMLQYLAAQNEMIAVIQTGSKQIFGDLACF